MKRKYENKGLQEIRDIFYRNKILTNSLKNATDPNKPLTTDYSDVIENNLVESCKEIERFNSSVSENTSNAHDAITETGKETQLRGQSYDFRVAAAEIKQIDLEKEYKNVGYPKNRPVQKKKKPKKKSKSQVKKKAKKKSKKKNKSVEASVEEKSIHVSRLEKKYSALDVKYSKLESKYGHVEKHAKHATDRAREYEKENKQLEIENGNLGLAVDVSYNRIKNINRQKQRHIREKKKLAEANENLRSVNKGLEVAVAEKEQKNNQAVHNQNHIKRAAQRGINIANRRGEEIKRLKEELIEVKESANWQYWANKGLEFANGGNFEIAEQNYRFAVQVNSKDPNPEPYISFAQICLDSGKEADRGLSFLEEALANHKFNRRQKKKIKSFKSKLKRAIKEKLKKRTLEQCLKRITNGGAWQHWAGLAEECALNEDYKGFKDNYSRAIRIDSGNPEPYLAFAKSCRRLNRMRDVAIKFLSCALNTCKLSRADKRRILEARIYHNFGLVNDEAVMKDLKQLRGWPILRNIFNRHFNKNIAYRIKKLAPAL